MTEMNQVYKCNLCGNIIVVYHPAEGSLVCCGEPMILMEEKTADQGKEKHVPVIEVKDDGILVKCGDVPHPMEEAHYIEWIEIMTNDSVFVQRLVPGVKPEAFFPIKNTKIQARAYCNVHGLWKNIN